MPWHASRGRARAKWRRDAGGGDGGWALGPRGGAQRRRSWGAVGDGEWTVRALCARMGSGHRPGSPSVTAQCDSRAFAGLRSAQVAPEPGGASAVRSSAAESRGQLPPAPRAGESCPPARPPPRKAAGVRSFPLVAVSYFSARPLVVCPYSGDWRACVRSPCSPHSPPPRAPPGSTLAQAPASGAGPGLCPAAPKLPALTAALPSLCAASARSRSAEVLSRPRGVTPRFLSALWEGGRARSRVGFTPRDPVLLSSLSWHQARC